MLSTFVLFSYIKCHKFSDVLLDTGFIFTNANITWSKVNQIHVPLFEWQYQLLGELISDAWYHQRNTSNYSSDIVKSNIG